MVNQPRSERFKEKKPRIARISQNNGGKCVGWPLAHTFIRAIREICGCLFYDMQRSVGRITREYQGL
jgi:hypothetical protein